MPLRSNTSFSASSRSPATATAPFDAEHLDLMSDFADHAAMALALASALEHTRHLTVLADRERIGHDLHDHVIQRLFAAGLDLQGTIAGPIE